MQHIFTVDSEEWFDGIDGGLRNSHRERRLRSQMEMLLHILRLHGIRCTFFWLGSSANEYPDLVKQTAEEGHEIGSHGYVHSPIYTMTPEEFRQDTLRSTSLLSDLIGKPIESYRAPYFSLTNKSFWALDILAELGIKYDSSIFPVNHWRYGIQDFPKEIQVIYTPSGSIVEAPLPVRSIGRYNIPATGGAYFRLFPYALSRRNFQAFEEQEKSAVFYIHPWELDELHPRVECEWKVRIPHYVSLRTTKSKLHRLLSDFSFVPLNVIASQFTDF